MDVTDGTSYLHSFTVSNLPSFIPKSSIISSETCSKEDSGSPLQYEAVFQYPFLKNNGLYPVCDFSFFLLYILSDCTHSKHHLFVSQS